MRSDQSIFLAGCQSDAYEVVRNALNRVGFRVAHAELDEIITAEPKPDCIVFYLTSDNSSNVQSFLLQDALLNARRIAILDPRDKNVSPLLKALNIDEILHKPVQMSRLVSAIDRVLGNTEAPVLTPANEAAASPDNAGSTNDTDMPTDADDFYDDEDEAADRAQQAWAIEQYQKRHGQELSPDAWKQMMLDRLHQDSSKRSKRLRWILGIAIVLIMLAIIVLILFKMNRAMDAQIHEQLLFRHR